MTSVRKKIMQKAKDTKNDEFYTRLEDVEKELESYPKSTFEGKCVFCNCNDVVGEDERISGKSAFATYFLKNFNRLGLKKLICLHYSELTLLNQGSKGGYIFTKDRYGEKKEYPPQYDGSFNHSISLKILNEEADLVCTNPPFSKSIEYWKILIKSGKKFIIISNIVNVVNTAYIPYFKDKKIWAGYHSVDNYQNPQGQLVEASGHWYCNVPIENRPKWRLLKITPLDKIPPECKTIDDNNTLLVSNGYIPSDYNKPFAVSTRAILNGVLENGYEIVSDKQYAPYINGKMQFTKVLIQRT